MTPPSQVALDGRGHGWLACAISQAFQPVIPLSYFRNRIGRHLAELEDTDCVKIFYVFGPIEGFQILFLDVGTESMCAQWKIAHTEAAPNTHLEKQRGSPGQSLFGPFSFPSYWPATAVDSRGTS